MIASTDTSPSNKALVSTELKLIVILPLDEPVPNVRVESDFLRVFTVLPTLFTTLMVRSLRLTMSAKLPTKFWCKVS